MLDEHPLHRRAEPDGRSIFDTIQEHVRLRHPLAGVVFGSLGQDHTLDSILAAGKHTRAPAVASQYRVGYRPFALTRSCGAPVTHSATVTPSSFDTPAPLVTLTMNQPRNDMLRSLKRLFVEPADGAMPHPERRSLRLAVATLLHESTRVDLESHPAEYAAAEHALADLFGLEDSECAALLAEARTRSARLTSYFAQVSVIKRDFSLHQRVALIEHLWHIAYAHGLLDAYEDHFVRKIAHLLHVPNTQVMLARGRVQKGL